MSRGRPAPLVKFQHIIQLFTVLLTAILISLFFGVLVLVGKIQGTARVVNYAGLVRGKTQLIVKLEIGAAGRRGFSGQDDRSFQRIRRPEKRAHPCPSARYEWPSRQASGRQKAGKEHPGSCTKSAVKETFSLTTNNAHPLWFFHRWVGILHFQTGWNPFSMIPLGCENGGLFSSPP